MKKKMNRTEHGYSSANRSLNGRYLMNTLLGMVYFAKGIQLKDSTHMLSVRMKIRVCLVYWIGQNR